MKYKYHIFLYLLIAIPTSYSSYASYFGNFGASFYQAINGLIGCRFDECCTSKQGWILPNIYDLRLSISNKLYGQHLVENVVVKAIISHLSNENPAKALVLSFHGWTGSGKNYVARFIAENIYKKGMKSKFVHLFVSTVHFRNHQMADIYKLQIQDWIRGNVSECSLSLFIFDEIDKMPPGVIDGIKPFIDYHDNIFGIDFRRCIFIFLSNTGSQEINRTVLKLWRQGRERHTIALSDMEDLIEKGAFNEEGGLHNSDLIKHSLVDFYVPFLPLERQHVEMCIKDEVKRRKLKITQKLIDYVIEAHNFFPTENQLYSSTGCKRVHAKVGYALTDASFDRMFDEL